MPAAVESSENTEKKGIIGRIDDLWAGLEGWAIVILLAAMIILAFTQVVMRNFFQSGFEWADIVVRHLMLWVGLLGASIAAKEGRHLNVDIASRLIPEKWYYLVHAFTCFITAAISGLFFWAGYKFVAFLYEYGMGMLDGKTAALASAILPIAFLGVAIRFLLRSGTELAKFWKKIRT
jgi:C4-dicarboxylate transporter DctQ subunit